MFGHSPDGLRHIPRSEYRKRRAYWRLVRKAMGIKDEDDSSVVVEKTGIEIPMTANVIGED